MSHHGIRCAYCGDVEAIVAPPPWGTFPPLPAGWCWLQYGRYYVPLCLMCEDAR